MVQCSSSRCHMRAGLLISLALIGPKKADLLIPLALIGGTAGSSKQLRDKFECVMHWKPLLRIRAWLRFDKVQGSS